MERRGRGKIAPILAFHKDSARNSKYGSEVQKHNTFSKKYTSYLKVPLLMKVFFPVKYANLP